MDKPIYVVGHKNPDTDSICAAIAYANLKKHLGYHTVAARAGSINRETEYVLKYFQVAEPVLLPDLHTRARDLLTGKNVVVRPEIPVREAWQIMRAEGAKTLPVVDREGRLLGIVTGGDLADKYLIDLGDQDLDDIEVTVENVVKTLAGTLINGDPATVMKGQVVIGAMQSETMGQYLAPGCIVLVGNRDKSQMAALEAGACCLILTGGAGLSPEVESMVKTLGAVVISVPTDTFTTGRTLLLSVAVGQVMRTHDLTVFEDDDLLDEIKRTMLGTRYRNYPVVNDSNQVVGEIARYHLLGYSKKQVILVDHNELSQAVEGIEEAQILEVVDYHRVGGIQTGEPILFRNEPVGSTCTLVAKAYFEHGITPSREMAGIMCAAILSDTVIFKSPTCTQVDRDMAARLASIAEINPVEFGTAMFKEGSTLSGRTAQELLETDFKEFTVGGLKIGIGQVSVMGTEGIGTLKADLLAEMDSIRRGQDSEYVLLMITDLLEEATTLLIQGQDVGEIGKAFKAEVEENQAYLQGVLSRKKQVVPPLVKFFSV